MVSGSVECIKDVISDDDSKLKLFTKGQNYGAYSALRADEKFYELITCDNENNTHIISDSKNDDYSEFENDGWFKEHFVFIVEN